MQVTHKITFLTFTAKSLSHKHTHSLSLPQMLVGGVHFPQHIHIPLCLHIPGHHGNHYDDLCPPVLQ